jgi:hypothetical protein
VFDGDPQIAGEGELHPATHCPAVHGGDHGLAAFPRGLEQVAPGALHRTVRAVGRVALGELLEVTTGAEGLVARAGEHHDPDVRITVAAVEDLDQLVEERLTERVAPVLAVDGQGREPVAHLEAVPVVVSFGGAHRSPRIGRSDQMVGVRGITAAMACTARSGASITMTPASRYAASAFGARCVAP